MLTCVCLSQFFVYFQQYELALDFIIWYHFYHALTHVKTKNFLSHNELKFLLSLLRISYLFFSVMSFSSIFLHFGVFFVHLVGWVKCFLSLYIFICSKTIWVRICFACLVMAVHCMPASSFWNMNFSRTRIRACKQTLIKLLLELAKFLNIVIQLWLNASPLIIIRLLAECKTMCMCSEGSMCCYAVLFCLMFCVRVFKRISLQTTQILTARSKFFKKLFLISDNGKYPCSQCLIFAVGLFVFLFIVLLKLWIELDESVLHISNCISL